MIHKQKNISMKRDNRELGVGISNSIALSDFAISNINLTKDELIKKIIRNNSKMD